MYKVFVNDCPIILTDDEKISTNLQRVNFESVEISSIVSKLLNKNLKGICLICSNLEVCWRLFQSKFKIQKAAGGKVFNQKKEILFIYRFDKWDLPKGKLEKNETIEDCAIREVEEECGVSKLKIENQLQTTYHIFERKGKMIFKITYWYLMSTTFSGMLIPQTEEGIKCAVFKDKLLVNKALMNTYENIKQLF